MGKRIYRTLLFATAMTSAGVANAQGTADGASAPDGTSAETGEGEIIVTANRRQQRLQDVPIAVTALSAESIERRGLNNTEALTVATPGLVFNRQANAATPFIRGLGNSSAVPGQEATVATYIDDVYMASLFAGLFNFNNIERVEVLKGPQGTLFGRNATGGVIQIITRRPSFEPLLNASIGYGNFDTISGSLYASTGLSETVAMDIAVAGSDQRGGWGRAITTGEDAFTESSAAVRSKLIWTPSGATTVQLIADYGYLRTQTGFNYHYVPGSVGIGGVVYGGFYNYFGDPLDLIRTRQRGISMKIEQDLGGVNLVSISSYRRVTSELRLDSDAGPAFIQQPEVDQLVTTYTQELQLLSRPGAAIQWIAGLYYLHDSGSYNPLTLLGSAFGPVPITIFTTQETDSYSAFAQATTELFDRTNLTLGLRYTIDQRAVAGRTLVNGVQAASGEQSERFPKLTWRAVLDRHFTDDVMGYLSYTRGFKSGIYNTIGYSDPAVRPEVVDSYEIGLKTQLFGRRLRFNIAAFYYDYRDIQVNQVQLVTVLVNAARARINGIDADFAFTPVPGLTFSGGASILDGRYTSFPDAPYLIPDPSGLGGNITAGNAAQCPPGSPFTGGGCDASGNRTTRSPKLTLSLALDYRWQLPVGTIDLNASFYHNSGFAWDPDNRLRQPAYQLVNTSVGWTSSNERWNARLWVRNLFDQEYLANAIAEGAGDHASPAPPRTFGVTVGVRLGAR